MAGDRGTLSRAPRAALGWAALASCAWLGAGCVSFTFRRETRETPVRNTDLQSVEVGRTSFGDVLTRFGAPLSVWEYKGDGTALAYGALRDNQRGVRVSVSVVRELSASVDYSESDARLRGVVFLFDADGSLEQWRRGLLADIRAETSSRRPAPIEPRDEAHP